MPTVLIRHPDGSESEQELSQELSVGRADGNDIILAEGGVSRRHARIFFDDGKVYVEDAGSANGTFVDGAKIDARTELKPRSQIVIGDYELSLKGPGARPQGSAAARPKQNGASPEGSRRPTVQQSAVKAARSTRVVGAVSKEVLARQGRIPTAPQSDEGPALRGLSGPWANKVFPVRGKVTVGRVAGVQVQVEDDSVSRRHAELEATPGGLVVRDLGSANGTMVNGTPAEGEVPLHTGDVLQFGVIEFQVEGLPEARHVRRRPATAVDDGGSRPGLWILAAVAAVALAGVAVRWVLGNRNATAPTPRVSSQEKVDAQVQEALSECRSYAAVDLTTEPDWNRAEAACAKALDLDPINPEGNQLNRRIKAEKVAAQHYQKGTKALNRLREDDAIDEFSQIQSNSFYYAKVKSQIGEIVEAGKKRSGDDCKRYAANGFWAEAVERCSRYMFLACQTMPLTDVQPPPGFTVKPPGHLQRHEWWPKDVMYQRLLTALSHQPNAPEWKCKYAKILQPDPAPPPPEEEVKKVLAVKFPDAAIAGAVLNYWFGKVPEARLALQKIREDSEKAPLHNVAEKLKKNIFDAEGLVKEGESALSRDELEEAAGYFDEALQLDADLLKGVDPVTRPSFYRRMIQTDVSQKALDRGRFFREREDDKRACQMFRVGVRFHKGNTDLLKAVGFCSNTAFHMLDSVQTCEDLDRIMDYVMPNDGVKERVDAQRAQLHCPARPAHN